MSELFSMSIVETLAQSQAAQHAASICWPSSMAAHARHSSWNDVFSPSVDEHTTVDCALGSLHVITFKSQPAAELCDN